MACACAPHMDGVVCTQQSTSRVIQHVLRHERIRT
jgi:hypothetical protein